MSMYQSLRPSLKGLPTHLGVFGLRGARARRIWDSLVIGCEGQAGLGSCISMIKTLPVSSCSFSLSQVAWPLLRQLRGSSARFDRPNRPHAKTSSLEEQFSRYQGASYRCDYGEMLRCSLRAHLLLLQIETSVSSLFCSEIRGLHDALIRADQLSDHQQYSRVSLSTCISCREDWKIGVWQQKWGVVVPKGYNQPESLMRIACYFAEMVTIIHEVLIVWNSNEARHATLSVPLLMYRLLPTIKNRQWNSCR